MRVNPGRPGVAVTLTPVNGPARTSVTAADGTYRFSAVPAGAGVLRVATPPGGVLSTGNLPFAVPAVAAGGSFTVPVIGYTPTASVWGRVFADLDGDGMQGPAEPGWPDVVVHVRDSVGVEARRVLSGQPAISWPTRWSTDPSRSTSPTRPARCSPAGPTHST